MLNPVFVVILNNGVFILLVCAEKWQNTVQKLILVLLFRLCGMTGLSDEQRANYKLMAAVGKHTIQVG